jgi:hypothetical protein
VLTAFGEDFAEPVLDLLELTEFAWHDCYGETSPSETTVDDLLLLSEGQLPKLIRIARLAIADWRDVKAAAQSKRADRDLPA